MQKKVYPQCFKDEVVRYYQSSHTIAGTIEKYKIAEKVIPFPQDTTKFSKANNHRFIDSCIAIDFTLLSFSCFHPADKYHFNFFFGF